jgi:hypothetical protein
LNDDFENADDSIRINCEFNSNTIDESDVHLQKHEQPRISIFLRISTVDELKKLPINLRQTISIKRSFSTINLMCPISIVIDDNFTPRNAEISMNRTFRGMTIDLSDEWKDADDFIRVNRDFDPNKIHESD